MTAPRLRERLPELGEQLKSFRSHLAQQGTSIQQLKARDYVVPPASDWHAQVWELQDVAVQAAETILTAPDPLQSLVDISQNFPVLAHVLAKAKELPDVRQSLDAQEQVHLSLATTLPLEFA